MDNDDHLETDTESGSAFAEAIKQHLALKSRNAGLDSDMPIDRYLDGDSLDNHPLFKSEEQARIEETMDGHESIPEEKLVALAPPEQTQDDDTLWGRSRDFDWGD